MCSFRAGLHRRLLAEESGLFSGVFGLVFPPVEYWSQLSHFAAIYMSFVEKKKKAGLVDCLRIDPSGRLKRGIPI